MANTGWGNLSWSANEWGNLADTTVLVSNPNDIAYGNEGWNEATFGGSNNNLVLNLDSVSITTELNAIAEPSGQQLNSSTGSVEAFSLVTVPVSGRQLNISQGDESVDLNNIYPVNGNGLTSSVGTVDAYNEIGWGRDDWGTEAWGGSGIWVFVDVTGLGLTIDSGDKEAWGELAWGSNEWGGAYITEVDNITFAAATGNQLNVAEGIADPSPDAMAVGIGMTIGVGLGSVSANADVTTTGQQQNISQGQAELDAVSFIEVGGLSIGTFSIGSPVVGASAEVDLTGNQVNIALGNEVSQIWRIVDTGTSVSYTEVSTGSTVTWNNVDTAA